MSDVSHVPKSSKDLQKKTRLKGLSNEFDAHVCSEAACTAACTLLLSHRVRCRICPQEELRILHCALHEFQPILLCLQDWEAVVVRIDATFKDCLGIAGFVSKTESTWQMKQSVAPKTSCIPVVAKVMSCNCGSNIRSSLHHWVRVPSNWTFQVFSKCFLSKYKPGGSDSKSWLRANFAQDLWPWSVILPSTT